MQGLPNQNLWIGSDHPFDLHEAYLNFRKDVELARLPRRAVLSVTADSKYKLWVNGSYVCRGPARCWPHGQQVDALNILPHLRRGTNKLAIQVYSPGYSHFSYVHRGAAGLLAWFEADGEVTATTGTDWRVQRDLSWRDDVARISIYGSGVERQDLRQTRDWQTELAEGPLWKMPRILAPSNGPVWRGLRERDIPLLREDIIALKRAAFTYRSLGTGTDASPHEALLSAWRNATVDEGDMSSILQLKAGEWAIRVFDLGHSRVCAGGCSAAGAIGGERVLVSYAEKLKDGKLILPDPTTYCRMRPTDEFALRAGSQTVESFAQRGGRYVVFAFQSPHPVALDVSFYARATSYPLNAKVKRKSPLPLSEVVAMCERTTLACLQDGFVDSVWRESSQWLGDCVAQSFALAALSTDYRPLRRAIAMAAQGAYDDGILPSVLPGEVHAYTVVDYNFSWIELVHFYCRELKPGDAREIRKSAMPIMEKMLIRFKQDEDQHGLLHSQPGRRLFLDWSPMDRGEPNLTYNCRYLHALQLARALSSSARDKSIYDRRCAVLSKAITKTFLHNGTWQESGSGAPASQLGLAMLILTGLLRKYAANFVAGLIVERSLDPAPQSAGDNLVLASPFMHHYVFKALYHLGRGADILEIIAKRWGAWAEAGEPTTWENWAIDFPDGSACHGFSAHPLGWIAKLSVRS
jgi:alpha-L-rhamnosidase